MQLSLWIRTKKTINRSIASRYHRLSYHWFFYFTLIKQTLSCIWGGIAKAWRQTWSSLIEWWSCFWCCCCECRERVKKNALEKEKQPNRVKRNGIIVCNALERTEDNQKSQCIHLAAAAAALQRKNKQAREKNGRQNKEESENVKYWNGKSGRICALWKWHVLEIK